MMTIDQVTQRYSIHVCRVENWYMFWPLRYSRGNIVPTRSVFFYNNYVFATTHLHVCLHIFPSTGTIGRSRANAQNTIKCTSTVHRAHHDKEKVTRQKGTKGKYYGGHVSIKYRSSICLLLLSDEPPSSGKYWSIYERHFTPKPQQLAAFFRQRRKNFSNAKCINVGWKCHDGKSRIFHYTELNVRIAVSLFAFQPLFKKFSQHPHDSVELFTNFFQTFLQLSKQFSNHETSRGWKSLRKSLYSFDAIRWQHRWRGQEAGRLEAPKRVRGQSIF